MTTAYAFCNRYWSEEVLAPLKDSLETITVLQLPDDLIHFDKVDKSRTIVLFTKSSTYNSLQILRRGFSHCIQLEREDFKKEMLISCLMINRPEILVDSKVPFFFKGFSKKIDWESSNQAILLHGTKAKDRSKVLEELGNFLSQNPKLKSVNSLALQIAEELYIQASLELNSLRKQNPNRSSPQSESDTIHIFAAFDQEQLLLGSMDSSGSFSHDQMTSYLLKSHSTDQISPDLSAGNIGLGLKMVIENTANFYMYCEKDRKTVIACGLLLKGIKANLSAAKHLHISFST